MNEHNHTISNGGPGGSNGDHHESSDLEVLIGRIIDGEASAADRRHFEDLASGDALLWRQLALRQQDMSMLAAHIEPALNAAERIELPSYGVARGALIASSTAGYVGGGATSGPRASWWVAVAGWAAVIAIAAMWGISQQLGVERIDRAGSEAVDVHPVSQAPEEHLRQYLNAPFVLGEMSPTMLNVEELPDGRYAVSYLRRIVEVSYFDAPEEIPLDEEGNLTKSPHELRSSTQPAPAQSKD